MTKSEDEKAEAPKTRKKNEKKKSATPTSESAWHRHSFLKHKGKSLEALG
jgi:hypothetical protein